MMKDSVEMRLPASTSNCGPGFDTLSIGLSLFNFCHLKRRGDAEIRARSDDAEKGFDDRVRAAAEAFFRVAECPSHGFDFEFWGDIPSERGLGSSSTVLGGVFLSLNELHGKPLGVHQCVHELTKLDNAPDNVCALVRGGFCISRLDPENKEYVDSFHFPVGSDLAFAVASPEIRILTRDARNILPEQLDFSEAISSLNGLAYLVAAFAKGDYERLRGSTDDRIHQPFRRALNPFEAEAIEAGVREGAYAGWLSGSGSSVICATPVKAALEVRQAMEEVYRGNDIKCRMANLAADNEGALLLDD